MGPICRSFSLEVVSGGSLVTFAIVWHNLSERQSLELLGQQRVLLWPASIEDGDNASSKNNQTRLAWHTWTISHSGWSNQVWHPFRAPSFDNIDCNGRVDHWNGLRNQGQTLARSQTHLSQFQRLPALPDTEHNHPTGQKVHRISASQLGFRLDTDHRLRCY